MGSKTPHDALAIIPARGGSKGIPRKNLYPLAGKPLLVYTLEASIHAKNISRVLVSTDDLEIYNLAKSYGVDVVRRPANLATDTAPIIDVVFHSLETLYENEGYSPDIVVLLQPTSPLRTARDIDDAVRVFKSCDSCLSLISVSEYEHSPYWALKVSDGFLVPIFREAYLRTRRQDLPKMYRPNGAIYIATPEVLREYRSFLTPRTIPYIMPPERGIDIDSLLDLWLAELILTRGGAVENDQ